MTRINIDSLMSQSKEIFGEVVQFEAVKQNGSAIQYFKKSWRKNLTKKIIVE